MKHRLVPLLLVILGIATAPALADGTLRLATTMSSKATGLLDVLLPAFEATSGYPTRLSVVGSGTALRMARAGDVDAVLVHAPAAEARLVADGYALARHPVMHNEFLLVGPPADPAGVAGLRDIGVALARIRDHGALFVSRGDDSGTHKKELQLWRHAGIDPLGQAWYHEAGAGIATILGTASGLQAYTLADKGSWIALHQELQLRVLVQGDPRLHNPYAVLAVNPARHPGVNSAAARAFVDWIQSPAAQALIDGFRVDGEQPFIADRPVE